MAEKKSIVDVINKSKESVLLTFAEAERKKGGRPKKETGSLAKENRFAVYLNPDELALIKSAADEFGMTVGKFIKMSALRAAKSERNNTKII